MFGCKQNLTISWKFHGCITKIADLGSLQTSLFLSETPCIIYPAWIKDCIVAVDAGSDKRYNPPDCMASFGNWWRMTLHASMTADLILKIQFWLLNAINIIYITYIVPGIIYHSLHIVCHDIQNISYWWLKKHIIK